MRPGVEPTLLARFLLGATASDRRSSINIASYPSKAHQGPRRRYHPVGACWQAVCDHAKLGCVRLHDLGRTAARQAGLSAIGCLGRQICSDTDHVGRPCDLAARPIVEVAENVGRMIRQCYFGQRC